MTNFLPDNQSHFDSETVADVIIVIEYEPCARLED